MTPTEAAALRERHQPVTLLDEENGPFEFCRFCDYAYPCDAIRALDYADEQRAIAERLAVALREAAAVAHGADSLRSHADDERKDGWFRAPFDRCADPTCEDANAALAAYTETERRP